MPRIRPAIVVALLFCLRAPDGVLAASTCDGQVLRDWSRDGQIDRVYELSCYHGAIDLLPPDLRDYTDAEDVIERALATALRVGPRETETPGRTPAPRIGRGDASASILLAALVGLSLAAFAAGGFGYRSRRRAVGRDDLGKADTLG